MSADTIDVKVTPGCNLCGGTGITMPDDPSPNAVITCPNCHAEIGTRGQFDAKVRDGVAGAARDALQKTIREALGGSTTIKLKF